MFFSLLTLISVLQVRTLRATRVRYHGDSCSNNFIY